MSSPNLVPGSFASSTREVAAEHGVGQVTEGRRRATTSVGPRSGGPGIVTPRASSPASNLESVAGCSPHGRCGGPGRTVPGRRPTAEPPRPPPDVAAPARCPVADVDHRVVERHLRHLFPVDPQGERPAPGPDLENLAERTVAGDRRAPADPPGRPTRALGSPAAGSASLISRRSAQPVAAGRARSLSVASSCRPRRRVRSTKPARPIRQSSVSR